MSHVILVSMPKSATVFVTRSLALTAELEQIQICNSGPLVQQISPQDLWKFRASNRAIGGQHFPPTRYNISLLQEAGIDRITLLLRDPRDALVSWWHHLERDDIRSFGWHHAMLSAAGLVPENYYGLSWEAKADALIKYYFPRLIEWRDAWKRVLDIKIQTVTYENFLTDKEHFIKSILGYHNIETTEIQFPCIETAGRIDHVTHFRRGQEGSYMDELTSEQISKINDLYQQASVIDPTSDR